MEEIKAEKYAAFNREFYKILQKVGTVFKPYEMLKILEFLEGNPMEQQAFLLVAEYCARKDGEKLTISHILNKAAILCMERKYTYEQVLRELSDAEYRIEKQKAADKRYREKTKGDYQVFQTGFKAAEAEHIESVLSENNMSKAELVRRAAARIEQGDDLTGMYDRESGRIVQIEEK